MDVFEDEKLKGFEREQFLNSRLSKYMEGDKFKAIQGYYWIITAGNWFVYLKLTYFSRFNYITNFY